MAAVPPLVAMSDAPQLGQKASEESTAARQRGQDDGMDRYSVNGSLGDAERVQHHTPGLARPGTVNLNPFGYQYVS
jgi:hypothetical protein